ncbi:GGDEF domain-containing protein [Alteraurantiacibacter buctensis]|uniref:diguanylate cyclase n=1 Tax=Alteraurantiacibacter buctensis TaxID=1503981 RepID=A0A844YTX5_9SPHN|nr:diguanylate cyclase [Alteraurantiacibacter buctensis]MXO70318.1 diguanylate cyclase [Alteraurantiacibacter buctensis]
MVGVVQRALAALVLAVLLGLTLSAPARAAQPVSRCVLASDQALTLDQARGTPGWNCQPRARDFAHEHLWVRLGLPPGRASEPQVLTSDALAFSAIDVVVSLADGRERRAHYTADEVARHWTLGTNFALPLLAKGEQATAVWLRVTGAIDRNNTLMATVVPERVDDAAREQGLVLFALFCGMLLIVAVYALALSVALKSPFSLWHGAMVAFLLLYTLSSSSLLHMALPGLGMWGRSATSYLSLSFSMAMMGPLLVTFLEHTALPRWAVRQAYGASIIAGMAGVLFVAVGPLFPFVSRPLYHVAFIPAVPCFAMLCVMAWRRGSRAIRVVALAWIPPVAVGLDRVMRGLNLYVAPAEWDYAFYLAMALQSVVMAAGITWRIGILRQERDLARAKERAQELLAQTDMLTGLPNRRAFDQRTWRRGEYLAILDADHFKRINDRQGHRTGDEVLVAIGAELARCTTEAGMTLTAFRLGGEEFAVAVTARSASLAALQVNVLRHRLSSAVAVAVPHLRYPLTVSAGLAVVGDGGMTDAYHAADLALYKAKNAGRDRLCYELDQTGTALIFPRPKAA